MIPLLSFQCSVVYSCFAYLLLCNKLPPNLAAWNNKRLFSLTASQGQEAGSCLSGGSGSQSPTAVRLLAAAAVQQGLTGPRSSSSKLTGVAAGGPQFLAGCCPEASLLRQVLLHRWPECTHDTTAGFFQTEWPEKGEEAKTEDAVLYVSSGKC